MISRFKFVFLEQFQIIIRTPNAFSRGRVALRCPMADTAEHKRVPRSVGNAAAPSARRPPGTANGTGCPGGADVERGHRTNDFGNLTDLLLRWKCIGGLKVLRFCQITARIPHQSKIKDFCQRLPGRSHWCGAFVKLLAKLEFNSRFEQQNGKPE